MTHFFDISRFDIVPIMVFAIIITMFGSYVVQIHEMMEHMREERSLRLMFSHYFIVISIKLMTVALELVHGGGITHKIASGLIIISLIVFHVSIMANKEYYREGIVLEMRDVALMGLTTLIGALVILLFADSLHAFLAGSLIITFGNFEILLNKWQKYLKSKN